VAIRPRRPDTAANPPDEGFVQQSEPFRRELLLLGEALLK